MLQEIIGGVVEWVFHASAWSCAIAHAHGQAISGELHQAEPPSPLCARARAVGGRQACSLSKKPTAGKPFS